MKTLSVKDLMTAPAVTVPMEAPLAAAIEILIDRRLGVLMVVDSRGKLQGVLSEGDLVRRAELGTAKSENRWAFRLSTSGAAEDFRMANGRRIHEVMSKDPITVTPSSSLPDAVQLMEGYSIKSLPVVEEGELQGVLTRADFVRALRPVLLPARAQAPVSDVELMRRIQEDFKSQRWAAAFKIDVVVTNGVVTLEGTVPSQDHLEATRVLVENSPGVRQVSCLLDVR